MTEESKLRISMSLLHENKKVIDAQTNEPSNEENSHKAPEAISKNLKLHSLLSDYP